jgi:hypothetical protein
MEILLQAGKVDHNVVAQVEKFIHDNNTLTISEPVKEPKVYGV